MLKEGYSKMLKDQLQKKFVKDSAWLLFSQAVLAVCGLVLNIIITKQYGISSFGNFSIALKIYLVGSIVASFGLGIPALKYSAQFSGNREMMDKTMSASIQLTLISSVVVGLLAFASITLLASFFGDKTLESVLFAFFLALPFYSMNKVLALILNGQRDIKTVAMIQVLRWALILSLISFFIFLLHLELSAALLSFPATEFVLMAGTWIYRKKYFTFSFRTDRTWLKETFSFGGKSMLSSGLSDLNSYLDVFLLGYFADSRVTGIYSFAADIAKNLIVVSDIFMTGFNPLISSHHSNNQLHELKEKIRQVRNITYIIYLPLIAAAITIYWFLIKFMHAGIEESFVPFIILSLGILLFSGLKPFTAILELAGFPGEKLKMNLLLIIANALLLLILAQLWNINGIALATSISYVVSIILLNWFTQRKLNISLIG
jgi:O-antigen/teichoic acid export membrane protein